jgi:hypothetical protein
LEHFPHGGEVGVQGGAEVGKLGAGGRLGAASSFSRPVSSLAPADSSLATSSRIADTTVSRTEGVKTEPFK